MDETHAECTTSMEIEDLKRDYNWEHLVEHDFACIVNTLSVNIRLDKPAKIGSVGRGGIEAGRTRILRTRKCYCHSTVSRTLGARAENTHQTYGAVQTGTKTEAFITGALWIRCWHVSILEGKIRPIPSLVKHRPASSLFSTLLSSSRPGGRDP